MKKNLTKISLLCLALVLFASGMIFKSSNQVLAEEHFEMVVLNGYGCVEVMPDSIEMTFCIKEQGEDFKSTQENLDKAYENFGTALKNLDPEISIFIAHSSICPSMETMGYKGSNSVVVKSAKLDLVNDFLSVANEQKISSFYGVNYYLENKQEVYNKALAQAKEDAEQKIASLYDDYRLIKFKECNIYSYAKGQKDSCVVVEATAVAVFAVNLSKTEVSADKVGQYI